jgi:RecA-family ATPase
MMEQTIDNQSIPKAMIYDFQELMKLKVDESTYLWGKILPQVGIGMIHAFGDVGKSTFARQLALSITYGKNEFLDQLLRVKHKHAIYCALEDTPEDVARCIQDQVKAFQEDEPMQNIRLIFESENPYETIRTELKTKQADIVIIDSFIHLPDLKVRNEDSIIDAFVKLNEIVNKYKCLILLIHHNSKDSQNSQPDKNNCLGSVYIANRTRIMLELTKDVNKANSLYLSITKANDLREDEKINAYKLTLGKNRIFIDTGILVPKEEIPVKKYAHNEKNPQKEHEEVSNIRKLTEDEKFGIFLDYEVSNKKQKDIAERYGISQSRVAQIVKEFGSSRKLK